MTWTLLNDVSQQWGGVIDAMAADPNVFGRVYLGVNGRGIIVGNPASSLPADWTDTDINTPGNPGWATNTTTLSTGTTVNQWTVIGGGAGIQGTSDQFNFASEPISGSAVVSAQLTAMTDADGNGDAPQSGVMIRGGADSNDPFAAIVQTANDTLVFEYRTIAGGTRSSVSLSGVLIGTEYVKIIRDGDRFSGYYSSDGTTWTQLGATVTISAMPTTANVGLAATASYNAQLTEATFANVSVNTGPILTAAAAASPNPATGSTTGLSVTAIENGSGAGLTYTWSAAGPGSVTYTGVTNGTNAANNITAVFSKAGTYIMTVTITDSEGLTISSSVTADNSPIPTRLAIVSQPGAALTGSVLLSPIVVGVEDVGGVVVNTNTSDVTLALISGPTSGALSGVTTVAAVNGLAVFNDIALTAPGDYTLGASDGSLTAATTGTIQVYTVAITRYLFNSVPLSPEGQEFEQRRVLLQISPSAAGVLVLAANPGVAATDVLVEAFAAAAPSPATVSAQPLFNSDNGQNPDATVLSEN